MSYVKKNEKRPRLLDPKPGLPSPKERAQLLNLMGSWYVQGKSQLLHGRGRTYAAQLYRQNWDGCRQMWKLFENSKMGTVTVSP
jgi:hypothetical protein